MVSDPWSDPATSTQPGAPYAGPPATVPYGHAPPPYGYPPASYGYPGPWGPPPPAGPRRPAQVITASVLSFVQAGLVFFASLYVWMLTSIAGLAGSRLPSGQVDALVTEGIVLAVLQLISAAVLVLAGLFALTRRSRAAWRTAIGANAAQLALALYWAIRMQMLGGDGSGSSAADALSAFTLFFAAAPLVALGLVVFGPGRRWFDGTVSEGTRRA